MSSVVTGQSASITTGKTTRTATPPVADQVAGGGPKPLTEGAQSTGILIALWAFVVIPFVALVAAVPVAWGGWLTWTDVAIAAICYVVSGLGVTVGFHRYLTHGSFKAKRWLRVDARGRRLARRSRASPTQWVADHRRHHAFSDLEGDPHSPWRYGATLLGPDQGPVLRAHGLAVPPRAVQPGALRAGPAGRQGHPAGRPAVPAAGGARRRARPAAGRRPGHLVLAGRADRVLLGRPGPHRAAAPRHLVDQLGLPRVRRAPVRDARRRQGDQLLAAGDPVVRRELAQPAPRRPDLRPPRRAARPDRHLRPDSSGSSRSSAGRTTSAGPSRSGSRPRWSSRTAGTDTPATVGRQDPAASDRRRPATTGAHDGPPTRHRRDRAAGERRRLAGCGCPRPSAASS